MDSDKILPLKVVTRTKVLLKNGKKATLFPGYKSGYVGIVEVLHPMDGTTFQEARWDKYGKRISLDYFVSTRYERGDIDWEASKNAGYIDL